MDFGRAAKFGLFASIGFVLVWSVLLTMIREVQGGVEGGTLEGSITGLLIVIGGTVVSLVFLFTLIGEYVDQELAARGVTDAEAE